MIERPKPEYRVGIGTDIHRLAAGRDLVLGGVHISFGMGLLGHSDGDAAIHAVIDALLGAAGLGDIGTFFPDTDPQWKDADSRGLLLIAKELLEENEWDIANVDLVIQAEQPRLEPFKMQIKRSIASILCIDFMAVSVKAKTNEGLGEIGSGQAIATTAVALLKKKFKRTL